MGFSEAVRLFFKNYFNFQGRSRRAEYWWPVLMFFIAYLVMGVVSAIGEGMGDAGLILVGIVAIIYGLFGLAIIIPSLSVAIRRLHDTNRSGWWLLLGLVPFIGSIVLLIFYCLEGTKGPNKYGPDPKGAVSDVF